MFCPHCGKQNLDSVSFCQNCGQRLSAPTNSVVTTTVPSDLSDSPYRAPQASVTADADTFHYAGFWLRFAARFVDSILCLIISGILTLPVVLIELAITGKNGKFVFSIMVFYGLYLFLVPWLYYTISEASRWQATVGKKMLRLKVTNRYGERIGFAHANGRYFAKMISYWTLYIGYIVAGLTDKKQALHDLIASTLVIRA